MPPAPDQTELMLLLSALPARSRSLRVQPPAWMFPQAAPFALPALALLDPPSAPRLPQPRLALVNRCFLKVQQRRRWRRLELKGRTQPPAVEWLGRTPR